MMLQALKNKRQQQNAIVAAGTLQAPIKGWYTGASLADAPPASAFVLDNAFVQLDFIRSRRGSSTWASGMGANVSINTLMNWTNGSVVKIFAATSDGNIYDVSNIGPVGAPVVTGLSNVHSRFGGGGYFEWLQHKDAGGGTWLVAVNGVDPVQFYNGTTWTTAPAWTGTGFTTLSSIWTFKGRLFGVATGSQYAWYLPVGNVGGAASLFSLAEFMRWGGALLTGGTWAVESVSGNFEFLCFITTEGEVLVYDGSDPTVLTLRGTYKVSRPLGVRCLMKAGGDLAIMTEDGIVPMSQVETLDQVALQNVAITMPIAPSWRQAVLDRSGIVGWQIVMWPMESMAIVNLPKVNALDRTQFIANARTGAWSRYLGWDANCFVVSGLGLTNSQLFYGTSDGRTMLAESGGQDDGKPYTVTIFPRFEHLGQLETSIAQATTYSSVINKQLRMVRINLFTDTPFTPQLTARTDYDTTIPPNPGTTYAPIIGGAQWGIARWGIDRWPTKAFKQLTWAACPGIGAVHSPVMQWTISSTSVPDIRFTAFDLMWEGGNLLG
jgi:hypothetical protein